MMICVCGVFIRPYRRVDIDAAFSIIGFLEQINENNNTNLQVQSAPDLTRISLCVSNR